MPTPAAPSAPPRRRTTALALVTGLVLLAAVDAPSARADTVPGGAVSLSETAPPTLLFGDPVSVTLSAHNPTGTPEYNVAFTEVLPVGVAYVPSSTGPAGVAEPVVHSDEPGTGRTTLVWNDVSDLPADASTSLTFRVQPSTSNAASNPYLPGGQYTDDAAVYVQSHARLAVRFDPVTGAVVSGSYTDFDQTARTIAISSLTVSMANDQPEAELPRGVHDHKARFTIKIGNTTQNATDDVAVDGYLPASLEFLGCGAVDHTTNAPTNPGANPAVEYRTAPRLDAGQVQRSHCPVPVRVETVSLTSSGSTIDSPPAQPVTACAKAAAGCGTYTHVVWQLGTVAAGQVATVSYLAGVPLRANTKTWTGVTPSRTGAQGSNLDNNSGDETHDAENITVSSAVSGAYTGSVVDGGGGSAPVSSVATNRVRAVDLAVQKTVDNTTFAVRTLHRWNLTYETGEYRTLSNVVLTDTLPSGLCPVDSARNYTDTAIEGSPDAACTARAGTDPSIAYRSVTEQPDTSFVLTWPLGALTTNVLATVQFISADRGIYAAADPVAVGDVVTNHVRIDGTAIAAPRVPGETKPERPSNPSAFTENTEAGILAKYVASVPAAHSLSATAPDCAGQAYSTDVPIYVEGDIVCFRLDIAFPTDTVTLDPTLTDVLPDDVDYLPGTAQAAPGNTASVASVAAGADGSVVFTLRDGLTHTGRRYVDAGDVFSYYLAVRVNRGPVSAAVADLQTNLLKLVSLDSRGVPAARRTSANFSVGAPLLHLLTGVQNVTSDGVKDADRGPNVDGVQVRDRDLVTVRVDLTDDGPVTAVDGAVTASLPTPFTSCSQVGAISDGGTCALIASRPVITWTGVPAVEPGGTRRLNYDLAVPSATLPGDDLVTTAAITGYHSAVDALAGTDNLYTPGIDGVDVAGTSDPTDVLPLGDAMLSIRKTHPGNFTAGGRGSYLLDISNTGQSDEAGPLTVIDRLPEGETYVDATGDGWSCRPDVTATVATCTTVTGLAAGAAAPAVSLTVEVAANVTAGTVLVNRASVTGRTDTQTHRTTDPTTIETHDDLMITKSHADDSVPGTVGAYLVSVTNLGPSDEAGPVTVTDTLPTGETFVAASGPGWTCDGSSGSDSITCTRPGPLPAGGAAPSITIDVAVDAAATGTVINRAEVHGTTDDTDLTNNTVTDPTHLQPSADLTIVKSHAATFVVGGHGTFTLQVTNLGPSVAAGVVVHDTLPSDETYVSASGTGWTCDFATGTLTCSLDDDLAVHQAAAPISLTVGLAASVTPGHAMDNTATVTGDVDDPDPHSNTSTDNPGAIDVEADLSIVKSSSEPYFVAGRDGDYTLDVHNAGPADVPGPIVVTDPLPTGETFRSAAGAGWNCNEQAGTVTCLHNAGLAVGGDAGQIQLTTHLAADYVSDTITNPASVALGPNLPEAGRVAARRITPSVVTIVDPDLSNNVSRYVEPVRAEADLAIVKTHVGAFTAGQQATYRLLVSNNGPSAAAAPIVVSDRLPIGERFVSATGTGWTCAAADGLVTCNRPDALGSGDAADPIVLVVALTGAAYPSITNTATVTGPTTDPVPGNNTSSDTAPVGPSSTLVVVKSHTTQAYAGGLLTYTIVVTDTGLTADPGPITVHDPLPAGETFIAASGRGWTCTHTGNDVTCRHDGALASGASTRFTLTVRTLPSAVPTVTNTVTVGSPSNTTPGTSSDPTPVLPVADLSLAKRLVGAQLVVGEQGSYVLTVTNHGPSATSGTVTITDVLPAALGYVSAGGSGWTCAAMGQAVVCRRTDVIADGASSSVRIVVAVLAASPSGNIVNTAHVASATPESPPGGPPEGTLPNGATVTNPVQAVAGVSQHAPAGGPSTPAGSAGGAGGAAPDSAAVAYTGVRARDLLITALLSLLLGAGLLLAGRRRTA